MWAWCVEIGRLLSLVPKVFSSADTVQQMMNDESLPLHSDTQRTDGVIIKEEEVEEEEYDVVRFCSMMNDVMRPTNKKKISTLWLRRTQWWSCYSPHTQSRVDAYFLFPVSLCLCVEAREEMMNQLFLTRLCVCICMSRRRTRTDDGCSEAAHECN